MLEKVPRILPARSPRRVARNSMFQQRANARSVLARASVVACRHSNRGLAQRALSPT
jgi:hypothetical protein